jgi:hypothetical protein
MYVEPSFLSFFFFAVQRKCPKYLQKSYKKWVSSGAKKKRKKDERWKQTGSISSLKETTEVLENVHDMKKTDQEISRKIVHKFCVNTRKKIVREGEQVSSTSQYFDRVQNNSSFNWRNII